MSDHCAEFGIQLLVAHLRIVQPAPGKGAQDHDVICLGIIVTIDCGRRIQPSVFVHGLRVFFYAFRNTVADDRLKCAPKSAAVLTGSDLQPLAVIRGPVVRPQYAFAHRIQLAGRGFLGLVGEKIRFLNNAVILFDDLIDHPGDPVLVLLAQILFRVEP